ncbi:hypothetical protein [Sphingomonas sp.]|jgi:hypothetical protein|uniref:hypothetical protein n=1 Tax=Sphingomonas sp. TaxID=28214 RepID=UPI0025F72767|nr:hypothetical protein [Sphingomonas sp.]
MNDVTLETLHADYETARADMLASEIYVSSAYMGVGGMVPLKDFVPGFVNLSVEIWASPSPVRCDLSRELAPLEQAARLYVIARDYGLEAAMLYKLSDGAIDPRVSE